MPRARKRDRLEDSEIEITSEMVKAGEEVLDRAFMSADLAPSLTVYSAVRDVYTAMRRIADHQQSCNPAESTS